MTLRTRLDRLQRVYPRNSQRGAPALDFSQLTSKEMFELDQLLAKLQGLPPLRNGQPDLSALSDAERDRLDALAARITETP